MGVVHNYTVALWVRHYSTIIWVLEGPDFGENAYPLIIDYRVIVTLVFL